MTRYAARTDANQSEIVAALRGAHWTVELTHRLGSGYPDLHASKDGYAILVEVKMPGEKLTSDEEQFHRRWQGPLIIAYSGQQAVDDCTRRLWNAMK